jgi:hypothetical protein
MWQWWRSRDPNNQANFTFEMKLYISNKKRNNNYSTAHSEYILVVVVPVRIPTTKWSAHVSLLHTIDPTTELLCLINRSTTPWNQSWPLVVTTVKQYCTVYAWCARDSMGERWRSFWCTCARFFLSICHLREMNRVPSFNLDIWLE